MPHPQAIPRVAFGCTVTHHQLSPSHQRLTTVNSKHSGGDCRWFGLTACFSPNCAGQQRTRIFLIRNVSARYSDRSDVTWRHWDGVTQWRHSDRKRCEKWSAVCVIHQCVNARLSDTQASVSRRVLVTRFGVSYRRR